MKKNSMIVALLVVVTTKPFVDMFYRSKLPLLDFPINLQSVVATGLAFFAFLYSLRNLFVKDSKTSKLFNIAYILLAAECLFRWLYMRDLDPGPIRILASCSIFCFAEPLATYAKSHNFSKFIFLSILSVSPVVFGALLQCLGVLHGNYVDSLPVVGDILRVTSLYRHPLDLVRVLIWFYVGILYVNYEELPGRRLVYILPMFQVIFLCTTHRTTLISSLLILGLFGVLYRKYVKTLLLALISLSTWIAWSAMPWVNAKIWYIFGYNQVYDARGDTYARGRSEIWHIIVESMKNQSFKEWLLGFGKGHPAYELESHNQLFGLFHYIGLVGIVFMFVICCVGFSRLKPDLKPLLLTLFTCGLYGLTMEPFLMPTMIWLMTGFMLFSSHMKTSKSTSPY